MREVSYVIVAVVLAAIVACARSGPEPVCVPGASVACTCEGEARGAKTCNVTGRYTRCACRSRAERQVSSTKRRTVDRSCSTVSYHVVQISLRHLWDNAAPEPDDDEATRELLDAATAEFTKRCETEQWSDAARSCLLAAQALEELGACGAL